MELFIYILIGICTIYFGKIQKRIKVGVLVYPISVPLGILTGIAAFILFQGMLILIGLIIGIIGKAKIFIHLKIGAILVSIGGAIFGFAIGPMGWVLTAILIIFIISSIKDTFISIFNWAFKKMGDALVAVRKYFKKIRLSLPYLLPILVLLEITIVCGLSVTSLWHLMDLVDGKRILTDNIVIYRIIVIIPFVFLQYRAYKKNTDEVLDVPLPDSPLLPEFMQ